MSLPKLLLVIAACLLIAFPASAQADRRTRNEFLSICASDEANPEVIKDFLDRGVDVDLKDRRDATALLLCARRGDVESCVFLLEQGADVNVVDSNGNRPWPTPASSACRTSSRHCSRLVRGSRWPR